MEFTCIFCKIKYQDEKDPTTWGICPSCNLKDLKKILMPEFEITIKKTKKGYIKITTNIKKGFDMRTLCLICKKHFKLKEPKIFVAEMKEKRIYRIWEADLLKCPVCKIEIVSNFAKEPSCFYWKHDCEKIVENCKKNGKKVVYDEEGNA